MTTRSDPSLDLVDFDQSTESQEGVDINYMARIRVQYLTSQSATLVTQTQFADAKAAALMTLSGLLLFRGPASIGSEIAENPLLIAAFVLHALCVIGCIWTMMPRIRRLLSRPGLYYAERFSWVALTDETANEQDFPEFVRSAQVSQLVLSQARANQAAAKVLHSKFRVLRAAFLLGTGAIACIALHWLIESACGAHFACLSPP